MNQENTDNMSDPNITNVNPQSENAENPIKKEISIAQIISYALHPLLMPTYSAIILFNYDSYIKLVLSSKAQLMIAALIFILTYLLPASLMLLMKHTKLIKSIEMEERKDRTLPFIITTCFYYMTFHLLSKFHLPGTVSVMLLGGAMTIVSILVINYWWKISAHMAGIGCVSGFLLGLNLRLGYNDVGVFIFSLLVAGIIGVARLKLKAHTQSQVYAGFAVGFFCLLGIMMFV